MLNLGKRINSTTIPSYGKNGLIQGMLTVTNFEHVKEISVTVESPSHFDASNELTLSLGSRRYPAWPPF